MSSGYALLLGGFRTWLSLGASISRLSGVFGEEKLGVPGN